MKPTIYHETSAAIYFDNGDGSLRVVQKKKSNITRTLAWFKTDVQGQFAYVRFRKALAVDGKRVYTMYRCPSGQTYDVATGCTNSRTSYNRSRRGNIPKKFAKVLAVLGSRS